MRARDESARRPGRPAPPRGPLALALLAAAAPAQPALAIPDMDPPDVPAEPAPEPPERLRVDLREGGKLTFSGVPPVTAGAVWEADGPLVLTPPAPAPAPELDLGPLAPPPWLRLSGTLQGSGATLELGAGDPDALLDWHGFSGPWQVGVDTRLGAGLDLAAPSAADAARADYGFAVPLRGAYGPLALETPLLGFEWGADEAPHFRPPGESARLSYTAPDPLAGLGLGDALTLHTEASARLGGTEHDPLEVRSRLAWEPWAEDAATWFRSSAEVGFDTFGDAWRADLSLRAELDLTRDLLPGRHLHLTLEYRNEDLLAGLGDGDGAGGNQIAGIRLEF